MTTGRATCSTRSPGSSKSSAWSAPRRSSAAFEAVSRPRWRGPGWPPLRPAWRAFAPPISDSRPRSGWGEPTPPRSCQKIVVPSPTMATWCKPAADDRKIWRMPFARLAAGNPVSAGEFPPLPVNSRFARFNSRFDGKNSRFLIHGNCLATPFFPREYFRENRRFRGQNPKISRLFAVLREFCCRSGRRDASLGASAPGQLATRPVPSMTASQSSTLRSTGWIMTCCTPASP